MAIYRLSVKIGKVGSGRAHFDYMTGNGKYKRLGTDDDIRLNESFNIPSWAKSDRDFWKEEERIGDGFRKIELALPIELTYDEQNNLVKDYIEENLKDYPLTYAIHDSKDGKNPHAHIMFSERKIDKNRSEPDRENYFKKSRTRKDGSISGGYKKDPKIIKGNRKDWLITQRESWAIIQNRYLKEYMISVSHKSLKEQGVERTPQIHVGSEGYRMKNQSERYRINQEIIASNQEHDRLRAAEYGENVFIHSLESSTVCFESDIKDLEILIEIETKEEQRRLEEQRKREEQRKIDEQRRLELAQKQSNFEPQGVFSGLGIDNYQKNKKEPTEANIEILRVDPAWPQPSNRNSRGTRLSLSIHNNLSTYSDGLIKHNGKDFEMADFSVIEEKKHILGKRLVLSTPVGKIEVPEKAYKQSKELTMNINRGMSR